MKTTSLIFISFYMMTLSFGYRMVKNTAHSVPQKFSSMTGMDAYESVSTIGFTSFGIGMSHLLTNDIPTFVACLWMSSLAFSLSKNVDSEGIVEPLKYENPDAIAAELGSLNSDEYESAVSVDRMKRVMELDRWVQAELRTISQEIEKERAQKIKQRQKGEKVQKIFVGISQTIVNSATGLISSVATTSIKMLKFLNKGKIIQPIKNTFGNALTHHNKKDVIPAEKLCLSPSMPDSPSKTFFHPFEDSSIPLPVPNQLPATSTSPTSLDVTKSSPVVVTPESSSSSSERSIVSDSVDRVTEESSGIPSPSSNVPRSLLSSPVFASLQPIAAQTPVTPSVDSSTNQPQPQFTNKMPVSSREKPLVHGIATTVPPAPSRPVSVPTTPAAAASSQLFSSPRLHTPPPSTPPLTTTPRPSPAFSSIPPNQPESPQADSSSSYPMSDELEAWRVWGSDIDWSRVKVSGSNLYEDLQKGIVRPVDEADLAAADSTSYKPVKAPSDKDRAMASNKVLQDSTSSSMSRSSASVSDIWNLKSSVDRIDPRETAVNMQVEETVGAGGRNGPRQKPNVAAALRDQTTNARISSYANANSAAVKSENLPAAAAAAVTSASSISSPANSNSNVLQQPHQSAFSKMSVRDLNILPNRRMTILAPEDPPFISRSNNPVKGGKPTVSSKPTVGKPPDINPRTAWRQAVHSWRDADLTPEQEEYIDQFRGIPSKRSKVDQPPPPPPKEETIAEIKARVVQEWVEGTVERARLLEEAKMQNRFD